MNYLIQAIQQGVVVATTECDEHPPETDLQAFALLNEADFCDVSRIDINPQEQKLEQEL